MIINFTETKKVAHIYQLPLYHKYDGLQHLIPTTKE